jgi:serine/threonine protein kinase
MWGVVAERRRAAIRNSCKMSNRIGIPKAIDHFEILKRLGSGGMGMAFLARDTNLGRNVAIKVVRLEDAVTEQEWEMLTERLLREAKIAAALDHSAIVMVLHVELYANQKYLVMQLVNGVTLESMLESEVALRTKKAVGIVKEVASALDYAHEFGVIIAMLNRRIS